MRVATSTQAQASIDETTRAILIVPPIPKVSVARFVTDVADDGNPPPVFVVMEGAVPPRAARKLYNAGVEAAFELPLDAPAMHRTIFRLTSDGVLGSSTRKRAPTEIALEELVRSRFASDATAFGPYLSVHAHRRYILLAGSVDALWKLELAIRIASETPGVEEVVGDGVRVLGESRSDRTIAGAIRAVLGHASAIDTKSIAITVRDGEATLRGSATNRKELSRAIDLVRQVRGVRKVDAHVSLPDEAKLEDRKVARRVRRALASTFPQFDLEVAVFGGIAVVSGRVRRAAIRMTIEEFVRNQEGVDRVVDKLTVAAR